MRASNPGGGDGGSGSATCPCVARSIAATQPTGGGFPASTAGPGMAGSEAFDLLEDSRQLTSASSVHPLLKNIEGGSTRVASQDEAAQRAPIPNWRSLGWFEDGVVCVGSQEQSGRPLRPITEALSPQMSDILEIRLSPKVAEVPMLEPCDGDEVVQTAMPYEFGNVSDRRIEGEDHVGSFQLTFSQSEIHGSLISPSDLSLRAPSEAFSPTADTALHVYTRRVCNNRENADMPADTDDDPSAISPTLMSFEVNMPSSPGRTDEKLNWIGGLELRKCTNEEVNLPVFDQLNTPPRIYWCTPENGSRRITQITGKMN